MREERAKKIHAEKELHERLRNRSKNHKSKLEAEIAEVKKQQELYGAKDLEGPTGSPPWFPENPEVVAEDQKLGEEEDALVAKKDAAGQLSETDEGRLNQIREQREKLQEDEVFEDFFEFTKVNMAELMEEWTLEEEREDCEELDAEEAYAIRAYLEGQIRREKRLTKYNILKVSSHKGYLLPRDGPSCERSRRRVLIPRTRRAKAPKVRRARKSPRSWILPPGGSPKTASWRRGFNWTSSRTARASLPTARASVSSTMRVEGAACRASSAG
ncbi:unnamed protein product [Effrenium voratum]|nr:unnamed protein product [Effrenium voratum]